MHGVERFGVSQHGVERGRTDNVCEEQGLSLWVLKTPAP
jgi:hypothetical protein